MKSVLLWISSFIFCSFQTYAQVDFEALGGAAITNPISNSVISTTDMLRVFGRISSTAPSVSGAMVYKTNSGLVQTSTNTFVSNTGTASESLISANINVLNNLNAAGIISASVLMGGVPTQPQGVTPTSPIIGQVYRTYENVYCRYLGPVGYNNETSVTVSIAVLGIGVPLTRVPCRF